MTIDTLLQLKASAEETSGTDGTGTALDLGGDWGKMAVRINVTVVDGDPPSLLDLTFEGSAYNSHWFTVAIAPQISGPGAYRVALDGGEAVDLGSGPYTGGPYFDAAPYAPAFRK